MSSPLRHPPLARRVLAALLAGLWLSALVGAIVHGERDEHRYCLEHGTFEEVAGPPEQAAPAPSTDAELLSTGASSADSHQECAFELGVRTPLEQAQLPHVRVPAPSSAAPTLTLATVAAPIPLLAFAPKSSPPAPLV